MFLVWLAIFLVCCIAENISESIKSYNYQKKGGFNKEYPQFKNLEHWGEKPEKRNKTLDKLRKM